MDRNWCHQTPNMAGWKCSKEPWRFIAGKIIAVFDDRRVDKGYKGELVGFLMGDSGDWGFVYHKK